MSDSPLYIHRGTSLIKKRTFLDPTVGLCLGSYGGPGGVGVLIRPRYPCTTPPDPRVRARSLRAIYPCTQTQLRRGCIYGGRVGMNKRRLACISTPRHGLCMVFFKKRKQLLHSGVCGGGSRFFSNKRRVFLFLQKEVCLGAETGVGSKNRVPRL